MFCNTLEPICLLVSGILRSLRKLKCILFYYNYITRSYSLLLKIFLSPHVSLFSLDRDVQIIFDLYKDIYTRICLFMYKTEFVQITQTGMYHS